MKDRVDVGCCRAGHIVGGRYAALVEEVSAELLQLFGRPVHSWSINHWAKTLRRSLLHPTAECCVNRVNSKLSTTWPFHFYFGVGYSPSSEGGLWSNYQLQQARPPKHMLVSQPNSSPNVRFHRQMLAFLREIVNCEAHSRLYPKFQFSTKCNTL